MKMLGKLARSLATRYVCQTCEKEKERRAVAHNATKCLERNTLLAESNQAASIEIHRLEKALLYICGGSGADHAGQADTGEGGRQWT